MRMAKKSIKIILFSFILLLVSAGIHLFGKHRERQTNTSMLLNEANADVPPVDGCADGCDTCDDCGNEADACDF